MNEPAECCEQELWSYSLSLYSHAWVKAQLLSWQNDYGINVCVVLWACWLDEQNRTINPDEFVSCINVIHACETAMLKPLRQVREAIKSPVLSLGEESGVIKQQILDAELRIERKLLAYLATQKKRKVKTQKNNGALGLSLFKRYLTHRNIKPAQPLLNAMAKLLALNYQ